MVADPSSSSVVVIADNKSSSTGAMSSAAGFFNKFWGSFNKQRMSQDSSSVTVATLATAQHLGSL